jgi:SRSO17 transposase
MGWADWDDHPLRQALLHQGAPHLGHDDGVRVFDPSAFAKAGTESVGVARQWCGRLGKVDPCHVALSLGSVSAKGHPLVDMRLSLPKAWTQEKPRLDQAGVPPAQRGYRTRHPLALAMLEKDGASRPQGWMAGDDDMGRP